MKPFKVPACIEEYLRGKTSPPFSIPPPDPLSLPAPPGEPGAGRVLDALMGAAKVGRPLDIAADDSGDAVAAAAIILSLASRLGIPAAGPSDGLFGAAPHVDPLRVEIGPRGVAIPDISGAPLLIPRLGLSISGTALAVVSAAARAGAIDYPSDFVAFDLETTGRDPWADEILEIGAVKYIGRTEAGTHSTFVRPSGPVPEEIVGMTGIDDGMVRDAPPPSEAVRGFLEFCGGLPLVAHNAPFDVAFLRRQAALRLGTRAGTAAEDTLALSRWLYPEAPGHRLGEMARLLGVPIESWHRAAHDARTAGRIYLALTDRAAGELRALRVLECLDLAALGTIASGLALDGENEILVKRGMKAMTIGFRLAGCSRASRMERPPPPRGVAEMLLSLDDRLKRRAALHALAGVVTRS